MWIGILPTSSQQHRDRRKRVGTSWPERNIDTNYPWTFGRELEVNQRNYVNWVFAFYGMMMRPRGSLDKSILEILKKQTDMLVKRRGKKHYLLTIMKWQINTANLWFVHDTNLLPLQLWKSVLFTISWWWLTPEQSMTLIWYL